MIQLETTTHTMSLSLLILTLLASKQFSVLPNGIIKALVLNAVMFNNAFPDKHGISQELSPREIVLRWQLSVEKHMRAQFGSFCVAYDNPSPNETNRDVSRGQDAICLGPTGNMQEGTYKFLCLERKRLIKRRKFKEFPMTDSIIKKVNQWGARDKQGGRLRFYNRNNEQFDLDESNEVLIEDNAPEVEAMHPDIPAKIPGVGLESGYSHLAVTQAIEEPEQPEEPTIKYQAAAAAANANFGPREVENLRGSRMAGVGGNNFQNITVNMNLIPANEGEIKERGNDK